MTSAGCQAYAEKMSANHVICNEIMPLGSHHCKPLQFDGLADQTAGPPASNCWFLVVFNRRHVTLQQTTKNGWT